MSDGSRKRTEVVSQIVSLGWLVERVAAGKIRVPRFQRAFVWKQPDLSALLDSVLRGFPIGSILVWDTDRNIDSTSRIGPVEIGPRSDGVVGYILDGQQRVSTLAGTLRLTDGTDSIVDQIDWRVYYDLDERAFVDHRKAAKNSAAARGEPQKNPEPRYFPVRSLLNTAGFFEACRRIQAQVDDGHRQRRLDEADRLASAFRDYQLPLISIREADLESAITVFARLNRTGRKMAEDELVSALTYVEGEFHLASKLNDFKAELKKKGFGGLDRVFLLRSVLVALERGPASGRHLEVPQFEAQSGLAARTGSEQRVAGHAAEPGKTVFLVLVASGLDVPPLPGASANDARPAHPFIPPRTAASTRRRAAPSRSRCTRRLPPINSMVSGP